MKKEIVGYITGIINSYDRTIIELKNAKIKIETINPFINFKAEYSDLLEFVIDIPEDNKEQSITNFNKALKNDNLKNKILELEETNENLIDNEKRMHEKLKAYECNDLVWKMVYEDLKAENKKLTDCTLDKKREVTMGRV